MSKQKIRGINADRVFYGVNGLLGALFILVTLYPLIFVVSASFSSGEALMRGEVWLLPKGVNLDAYRTIFKMPEILRGFVNSLLYTALGTAVNVVFTVLAAYPLSRKDLYGRPVLMFLFAFTMMFSGGLIPTYLLVRDLKLLNSVWALILPGALSVWNMTITMNFFRGNLPDEMLEATQIDGCSDVQFLWRFAVPLSKSILAVIALFYAVGHWNSYFSALIYLTDARKYPLQLVLRDILINNQLDISSSQMDVQTMLRKEYLQDLLKYAIIVVSTVPMMILYPFVQKYLVKGVMLGSLKG